MQWVVGVEREIGGGSGERRLPWKGTDSSAVLVLDSSRWGEECVPLVNTAEVTLGRRIEMVNRRKAAVVES